MDLRSTEMVAPTDHVDCGNLSLQGSDLAPICVRVPAARDKINYQVPIGKRHHGLVDRDLHLDGRTIVRITRKTASRSQITVSSYYVIARTLNISGKSETLKAARRQFMDFSSNQVDRFSDGSLRCQANGALERYLQAPLRSQAQTDPILASLQVAAGEQSLVKRFTGQSIKVF